MVKKLSNYYFIFTLLLILILIVTGFMGEQVFYSPFMVIVFILYAGLSLSAIIWSPRMVTKIFHVLTACLILTVAVEKHERINDAQLLPMGPGGEYHYIFGDDSVSLELLEFIIENSEDTLDNMPRQFVSVLKKDGQDTVYTKVNHPLRLNDHRIYQQSYGDVTRFMVSLNRDTAYLFPGQESVLNGAVLKLTAADMDLQRISMSYCDIDFRLSCYDSTRLCGVPVYVEPADTLTGSILYAVPVKGHTLILVIALCMVAVMGWDIYRREGQWN